MGAKGKPSPGSGNRNAVPPPNPKVKCPYVAPDGKPCGREIAKFNLPAHYAAAHGSLPPGTGPSPAPSTGTAPKKIAFPRSAPPTQPAPAGGGGTPSQGGWKMGTTGGVMPPLSGIWDTWAALENMVLHRGPKVHVTPEFSRAMDANVVAAFGQGAVSPIHALLIGIGVTYGAPAGAELVLYAKERGAERRAKAGGGERPPGEEVRVVRPGGGVVQALKSALPRSVLTPHEHPASAALDPTPKKIEARQAPDDEAARLRRQLEALKEARERNAALPAPGEARPVEPPVSPVSALPPKGAKKRGMPTGSGGREA